MAIAVGWSRMTINGGTNNMNTVVIEKVPEEGQTGLPNSGQSGQIYLVPAKDSSDENNKYDEFVYVNGQFEKIGGSKTDTWIEK